MQNFQLLSFFEHIKNTFNHRKTDHPVLPRPYPVVDAGAGSLAGRSMEFSLPLLGSPPLEAPTSRFPCRQSPERNKIGWNTQVSFHTLCNIVRVESQSGMKYSGLLSCLLSGACFQSWGSLTECSWCSSVKDYDTWERAPRQVASTRTR